MNMSDIAVINALRAQIAALEARIAKLEGSKTLKLKAA